MLNVDTNTWESPFPDLDSLPSEVVSLRRALGGCPSVRLPASSPAPSLQFPRAIPPAPPTCINSEIKGSSVCGSAFPIFTSLAAGETPRGAARSFPEKQGRN